MVIVSKHFIDELAIIAQRQDGRRRHLVLFSHEGLHVLDRWRVERGFNVIAGPKDI